jgi:hypothetical protein
MTNAWIQPATFAAVSVPFLILAPVTELAFNWTEPTELLGKTNLVAAVGVVLSAPNVRAQRSQRGEAEPASS